MPLAVRTTLKPRRTARTGRRHIPCASRRPPDSIQGVLRLITIIRKPFPHADAETADRASQRRESVRPRRTKPRVMVCWPAVSTGWDMPLRVVAPAFCGLCRGGRAGIMQIMWGWSTDPIGSTITTIERPDRRQTHGVPQAELPGRSPRGALPGALR